MKIMLIGSMAFIKDMLEIKKDLEGKGHIANIPKGSEPHLSDSEFVERLGENLEFCLENDIMKENFNFISEHDAVLVVNNKRKGVDGYIGVSALMELGVCHYLGKKIFILNKIPHYNEHRWAQEVLMMNPTIINGNLENIL